MFSNKMIAKMQERWIIENEMIDKNNEKIILLDVIRWHLSLHVLCITNLIMLVLTCWDIPILLYLRGLIKSLSGNKPYAQSRNAWTIYIR